jgi:hypothetical protein
MTLNLRYLMKIISKILQPAICESLNLMSISIFARLMVVVSPHTEVVVRLDCNRG